MTDLIVIANGRLQNGRGARTWKKVEHRLLETFGNSLEIRFTSGRGDATRIAAGALSTGSEWIVSAGGDGTLNEVVNGFFVDGKNIRPEAALTVLPCGSGNDFARTLGINKDPLIAATAIGSLRARRIDAGLARFRTLDGKTECRIFLNVAEAGVGGKLVADQSGQPEWSRLKYRLGALNAALTCNPFLLGLAVDGSECVRTPVLSLIVAGGSYFGHGMHCAPMARPDDGLLEVITLGPFSRLEILRKMNKLFRGTYLSEPKVAHRSAHAADATTDARVLLQLDGELAGTLPAQFEVRPSSLKMR